MHVGERCGVWLGAGSAQPLQVRQNPAHSFDYPRTIASYKQPPANSLCCLFRRRSALVNYKRIRRNVQKHACKENTHSFTNVCLSHILLSYQSLHFKVKESRLSHERQNFQTFHLLLSSLLLARFGVISSNGACAIC